MLGICDAALVARFLSFAGPVASLFSTLEAPLKGGIGSANAALQDKIEVNGKNAHPMYTYLKKATKTGMLFLASAVC